MAFNGAGLANILLTAQATARRRSYQPPGWRFVALAGALGFLLGVIVR